MLTKLYVYREHTLKETINILKTTRQTRVIITLCKYNIFRPSQKKLNMKIILWLYSSVNFIVIKRALANLESLLQCA